MGTKPGMDEAGKIPDIDSGVQMANGNTGIPAAVPAAPAAQLTVRQRILNVQRAVAVLELDSTVTGTTKSGGTFSFKGISAAQVVARAKAALIANGVLYMPVEDRGSVKLEGNRTSLWVDGEFINVDDESDVIIRGAWGAGTDNADNGYAKAFTNANKQILAKTLSMTTVDDEKTVEVEFEPDTAAHVRKEAKQNNNKTLQAWASSYKAALTKATTIDELVKLQKQNRDQLMADEMPEITKDFFIELFEQRKKLLSAEHSPSIPSQEHSA
jgi:hypothetical protein